MGKTGGHPGRRGASGCGSCSWKRSRCRCACGRGGRFRRFGMRCRWRRRVCGGKRPCGAGCPRVRGRRRIRRFGCRGGCGRRWFRQRVPALWCTGRQQGQQTEDRNHEIAPRSESQRCSSHEIVVPAHYTTDGCCIIFRGMDESWSERRLVFAVDVREIWRRGLTFFTMWRIVD